MTIIGLINRLNELSQITPHSPATNDDKSDEENLHEED